MGFPCLGFFFCLKGREEEKDKMVYRIPKPSFVNLGIVKLNN